MSNRSLGVFRCEDLMIRGCEGVIVLLYIRGHLCNCTLRPIIMAPDDDVARLSNRGQSLASYTAHSLTEGDENQRGSGSSDRTNHPKASECSWEIETKSPTLVVFEQRPCMRNESRGTKNPDTCHW